MATKKIVSWSPGATLPEVVAVDVDDADPVPHHTFVWGPSKPNKNGYVFAADPAGPNPGGDIYAQVVDAVTGTVVGAVPIAPQLGPEWTVIVNTQQHLFVGGPSEPEALSWDVKATIPPELLLHTPGSFKVLPHQQAMLDYWLKGITWAGDDVDYTPPVDPNDHGQQIADLYLGTGCR